LKTHFGRRVRNILGLKINPNKRGVNMAPYLRTKERERITNPNTTIKGNTQRIRIISQRTQENCATPIKYLGIER
jgi:hypothetical protein